MCSAGYTEINKSTRIDSILRLGKDSIEGYQSSHNSNFLLKQNKLSSNKFNQRIIYTKNKSKSKILDDGFIDYDANHDDNDDDDDQKTSLTKIVRFLNMITSIDL
jgi:hypothetical protein